MRTTLTPKDKERIRYLYRELKLTQPVIAIRFGITQTTVSRVIRNAR